MSRLVGHLPPGKRAATQQLCWAVYCACHAHTASIFQRRRSLAPRQTEQGMVKSKLHCDPALATCGQQVGHNSRHQQALKQIAPPHG